MPENLSSALAKEDDSNRSIAVIPKLAELLRHRSGINKALLCFDETLQIWKLPSEGAHFCGYRNIQMLLSGVPPDFLSDLPTYQELSVLHLQDLIEKAWDRGFNSHGRVQTGGIRGTRKHIGTSEAEALALSLGLQCTGRSFAGRNAWRELLDSVEAYFDSSTVAHSENGVSITKQCPIFLQRPKHSLTVIGIERYTNGRRRLLVFDPAWRAPRRMTTMHDTLQNLSWLDRLTLRNYSKSERHLSRFAKFETLEIDCQP